MTVEQLEMISLAAYVLAGVFFLIAVYLFFLFRIPKLVGDLTGSNAKRNIAYIQENMQKENKIKHSLQENKQEIKEADAEENVGLEVTESLELVEDTTILPEIAATTTLLYENPEDIRLIRDITFIYTKEFIE